MLRKTVSPIAARSSGFNRFRHAGYSAVRPTPPMRSRIASGLLTVREYRILDVVLVVFENAQAVSIVRPNPSLGCPAVGYRPTDRIGNALGHGLPAPETEEIVQREIPCFPLNASWMLG
jgi:hypothetical protein